MVNPVDGQVKHILGLSGTAFTMCCAVIGCCAALLPVGLAVNLCLYSFEEPLAYVWGLVAGSVLSILKIILLERALERTVDMGRYAPAYATAQALLRYVLTAAVLLPAFAFPDIVGRVGVIAGALLLQFAAYITGYMIK